MTSFFPLAAIGAPNIEIHVKLVKGFFETSSLPAKKRNASQFLLSLLKNKALNLQNHSIANAIFLLLIPYGLTEIPALEENRLRVCLARTSHIRAEDLKTWLPQSNGVDSEKASLAISILYDSVPSKFASTTMLVSLVFLFILAFLAITGSCNIRVYK